MHSRIRKALTPSSRGPWILVSAIVVALLVTPFAFGFGEGKPILGGKRSPSPDSRRAYTSETQIIADTSTYGTRQSNKSNNGGGAIYGCRSAAGGTEKGNEPCIRANNLSDGRAFEFSTNKGAEVGRITSNNVNAAPFTTNAGGVATGLNADKVDGKSADQIVAAAQSRFAAVNGADGALQGARGAKTSSRSAAGVYAVTFDSDVSKCARTATLTGAEAGLVTTEGTAADTVTVHTFGFGGGAPAPADRSFHLVVTC